MSGRPETRTGRRRRLMLVVLCGPRIRRTRPISSDGRSLSSVLAHSVFCISSLLLLQLLPLLLASLHILVSVSGQSTEKNLPKKIPNQDQYFYYGALGHHVQEFVSEQNANGGGHNKGENLEKPDFLYSTDYPNGRVVEFYAHWCPHCKHFKSKYMELSNKLFEASQSSHATVEVFAVSCVPNKGLCGRQGIHGYPTVMVYPPKSVNGTKINHGKLHPMELMRMVGLSEQQQKQNEARETPPAKPQQPIITADVVDSHNLRQPQQQYQNAKQDTTDSQAVVFMHRNRLETFHDAHLSFNFAMKTAIYTSEGPLPKKPKEVLKRFLSILQKTLPMHSTLHGVVNDLIEKFEYIAQGDSYLEEVLEQHPPPVHEWSPASRLHGTGYTAGLWQLFHIMSVGLVEWNHMSVLEQQRLSPVHVADALRDYIEQFFQCEVCRLNFMSEYDACSHDRCNRLVDSQAGALAEWIQFPLWLYETHNSVNVRLRKERIDLHDEPDDMTTENQVMWPPAESCPSCWMSAGRWDEVKVYEFLHETYWSEQAPTKMLSHRLKRNTTTGESVHATVPLQKEASAGSYHYSIAKLAAGLIAFAMIIVWNRKRQFDRKGFHKKSESDVV